MKSDKKKEKDELKKKDKKKDRKENSGQPAYPCGSGAIRKGSL